MKKELTDNLKLLLDDENIVLALRVAIRWKAMKTFCRNRTSCAGCPYAIELSHNGARHYACSIASDEAILFKIADLAESMFIRKGIPT